MCNHINIFQSRVTTKQININSSTRCRAVIHMLTCKVRTLLRVEHSPNKSSEQLTPQMYNGCPDALEQSRIQKCRQPGQSSGLHTRAGKTQVSKKFLGFQVFRFSYTKTRLRNSHKNILYMIHPSPCHIIYLCADYRTAINATTQTERRQFSDVTVSLKSGFLRFSKNL